MDSVHGGLGGGVDYGLRHFHLYSLCSAALREMSNDIHDRFIERWNWEFSLIDEF